MLNSVINDITPVAGKLKLISNLTCDDHFYERVDALYNSKKYVECYNELKNSPDILNSHDIKQKLDKLYRSWIPRWHFGMLNDMQRNTAFSDAISKIDLKDKIVLDIGTGSGLLSMIAAKQNVRHIYTCEAIPAIADKATEIINKNGFSDRITVIPKMSFDIKIGDDLPCQADVLISETIDCGFIGEGFLSSLQHAKNNLLKTNPFLLPQKFSLKGQLIESKQISKINYVNNVLGFDLSNFNEFSSKNYFPVRLNTWEHKLRSEIASLININLYEYEFHKIEKDICFKIVDSGEVHGVVFWFEVELIPGITITNSINNLETHWMQAFVGFEEPRLVTGGESLQINFTLDINSLKIVVRD